MAIRNVIKRIYRRYIEIQNLLIFETMQISFDMPSYTLIFRIFCDFETMQVFFDMPWYTFIFRIFQ